MDRFEPLVVPRKYSWLDRLQALFEVLLLAGVVSSLLAALPFSISGTTQEKIVGNVHILAAFVLLEAAITLILLLVILKVHRESLRDLGWRWDRWRADAAFGLGLVPILFVVNIVVGETFRRFFPSYFIDRNPLIEIIRSPQELAIFIVAALLAGGFKEEFQRAFILTRFREHLGGVKLGLLLWSFAFGAGHYIQGLQGAVAAGLFGFLFGAVYLLRGSLAAPIIAHAVYDTLALLGYWYVKGVAK